MISFPCLHARLMHKGAFSLCGKTLNQATEDKFPAIYPFSVNRHFLIRAAGPVGVYPSSHQSQGRETLGRPTSTPPHSHTHAYRQISLQFTQCNLGQWEDVETMEDHGNEEITC